MTIPPVVPPQATQLRASQVVRVGNPFFRYLLATVCILFAMTYALLSAYEKAAMSLYLAAVVLTPFVFGCALASERTFTFLATTLKPFVPRFGGGDK